MFLWRNILSAACWIFCCTPLFAQEIDYSKCSCDSLFQKVFKDNYLKSYSDSYQEKRRYIEDNKCIIANDIDSTVIRYETETLWITESDTIEPVKLLITIKTDSTVFHKKNKKYFSEVELYQRKVSDLEIEYKHFKKDFGLELRLRVLKSIAGEDSAFYYYSENNYASVREMGNQNGISMLYKQSMPIKYAFTIDTNGYLHGEYIAYCPDGEIMTTQTFSHGIKNGYFYYATTCKLYENSYGEKLKKGKYFSIYYNNESPCLEYSKAFFKNGELTGKWIERLELDEGLFAKQKVKCKRYVLKYGKDNKAYLRKFFFYRELSYDPVRPDYFFDQDLDNVIRYINHLYKFRISDLTDYKSEYQKKHGPYYDIIKLKKE